MKAAVLNKYGHFLFKDVAIPEIDDNQVLVQTTFASICGTDQHIFKGEFHPRTQVPFIPGHEFTGRISAVGKDVATLQIGERVVVDPILWCGKCAACERGHYPACTALKLTGVDMDGGFGEFVAVHERQIYRLDDKISDQEAALVEVLSIGFHACSRAGLSENDTAVIWGAGKIGQCILQAARTITQNKIFMVDLQNKRLQLAQDNFDDVVTINITEQHPVEIIREITEDRGVDVAFEAVGHFTGIKGKPDPVQGCIQSIRGAGTVCVLGLSNEPTSLMMKELIWKEARLIASRVSHGEFINTIQQLAVGNLKPHILVSEVMPVSRVQEAFQLLDSHPEQHLKILLDFSGI